MSLCVVAHIKQLPPPVSRVLLKLHPVLIQFPPKSRSCLHLLSPVHGFPLWVLWALGFVVTLCPVFEGVSRVPTAVFQDHSMANEPPFDH